LNNKLVNQLSIILVVKQLVLRGLKTYNYR